MSSVVSENRPTSPTARSDDSSHSVSSSVNTPVGSPLGMDSYINRGPSWPSLYGSWIYLSPLML
jgi:hypothetical protein